MAVAALILGIVALVCLIIGFFVGAFFWVALICGIAGIVLGAIGIKKGQKKGMAITGLVLSCVAVAIALIFVFIGICTVATVGSALNYYGY